MVFDVLLWPGATVVLGAVLGLALAVPGDDEAAPGDAGGTTGRGTAGGAEGRAPEAGAGRLPAGGGLAGLPARGDR